METDEVGAGQQLGQLHHPGPVRLGHIGRDVGIGGQHGHLEGQRPVAHRPADAAEADQAECRPGQLHADVLLAVPAAPSQRVVGLGDPAGRGQHQGKGVLGRGQRVGLGRVDHRNPLLGRSRQVDVVDTDPGTADHPEARPGRDHLGVDPSAAAHYQRGRVPHRLQQIRPALALREDDIGAGLVVQAVGTGLPQRLGHQDSASLTHSSSPQTTRRCFTLLRNPVSLGHRSSHRRREPRPVVLCGRGTTPAVSRRCVR